MAHQSGYLIEQFLAGGFLAKKKAGNRKGDQEERSDGENSVVSQRWRRMGVLWLVQAENASLNMRAISFI